MLALGAAVPSFQPHVQQLKAGIRFVTGSTRPRGPAPPFQLLCHCQVLTHSSIYSSHSAKVEQKGHVRCREHRGEDVTKEMGMRGIKQDWFVSHCSSVYFAATRFPSLRSPGLANWQLFQHVRQELYLSPTGARAVNGAPCTARNHSLPVPGVRKMKVAPSYLYRRCLVCPPAPAWGALRQG